MDAAGILAGGTRLVRAQRKAVAIWGGLYLAACLAVMALIWPMFADLATFQQQAITAQAAGLPPPPPPSGFMLSMFGIEAVMIALLIMIFAAAVRATALGGDDRFGFLRVGMDELRLLGLGLLLGLTWFVATIVLGFVAALAAGFTAALSGGSAEGATGIVLILMLAFMVLTIWVQVRISLAGALTVLRGRIVIREAWRLTRGRFWTLFGVYLLVFVAYCVVTLAVLAVVNPDLLAAYADGMQPAAMQAALAQQQAAFADPFSPRVLVMWGIGAVAMTLGMAFTFGAIATAAIGFDQADRA
jgi:hypothetical protein